MVHIAYGVIKVINAMVNNSERIIRGEVYKTWLEANKEIPQLDFSNPITWDAIDADR